ncbi:ankyrin repeat-containing domain protein [Xylariaceae sp. FL0662B]|nr:ankyrin repeat-containing domain protein [Xylariaceae sp. FL0662B]
MCYISNGISKPLIHVCLQPPRGSGRDWRYKGSSVNTVGLYDEYKGIPLLKLLIGKGVDIDAKDPHDHNVRPLIIAARYGIRPAVDLLLAGGAKVNASDSLGFTALHGACICQDHGIIFKLLESGARINATTSEGLSPLHVVCLAIGRYPSGVTLMIIELLLRYGANPRLRASYCQMGMSALEMALWRSDLAAAKLLLSECDPVPRKEEDIWCLFRIVLLSSDPMNCLKFVLSVDKQKYILRSEQSLLRLLKSGRNTTDAAMVLLDEGAPCDSVSAINRGNAVSWAVENHKGEKLLRTLLGRGVSPIIIIKHKRHWDHMRYPLLQALKFRSGKKRRAYVKLLLDYRADINLELNSTFGITLVYAILTEIDLFLKARNVTDILFQPSSFLSENHRDRSIELSATGMHVNTCACLQEICKHGIYRPNPDTIRHLTTPRLAHY